MNHTQLVVFGRGEYSVDCHPQLLGEVFEPSVVRGLQDYRVLHQEDAPRLILVPVLPPLLLHYLDRCAATRSEGDLMDLPSSFDRETLPPEHLLDCRDVPLHLRHRTKPDLTQDQHQRLR